jgi:sugar lactone lactonase YvrE
MFGERVDIMENRQPPSCLMPFDGYGRIIQNPSKPAFHLTLRVNLIIPDHDWELIAGGYQFTEGPAVGVDGEVYYVDVPTSKIYVARDNGYEVNVSVFVEDSQGASGLMLGPDKKLYAAQGKSQRIVRYDQSGKEEVIVENSPCNDLVVYSGGIYYTDPGKKDISREL